MVTTFSFLISHFRLIIGIPLKATKKTIKKINNNNNKWKTNFCPVLLL